MLTSSKWVGTGAIRLYHLDPNLKVSWRHAPVDCGSVQSIHWLRPMPLSRWRLEAEATHRLGFGGDSESSVFPHVSELEA